MSNLFPETLEIHLRGENFIARGQCAKDRLNAKLPKPQKQGLKAFCADMLARDVSTLTRQAKSATVEFSYTYSPEDTNRLDEIGMGRRFAVGRNRIFAASVKCFEPSVDWSTAKRASL